MPKKKFNLKDISIRVIATVMALLMFTSSVSALNFSGTGSVGNGNYQMTGTSFKVYAGGAGYADELELAGLRISVYNINDGTSTTSLDIYRHTASEGDKDGFKSSDFEQSLKFLSKRNKLYLKNHKNDNYQMTRWYNAENGQVNFNTQFGNAWYSDENFPYYISDIKKWASYGASRLDTALSMLRRTDGSTVGSVSNLRPGDKIFIEPIMPVKLKNEPYLVTLTELAVIGGQWYGFDTKGDIPGGKGIADHWGWIVRMTQGQWCNALYINDWNITFAFGRGWEISLTDYVSTSLPNILTFNQVIDNAYGIAIGWDQSGLTVNYHSNEGSNRTETRYFKDTTSFAFENNMFAHRIGKQFMGWSWNAVDNNVMQPGYTQHSDSVNFNYNLYAQWGDTIVYTPLKGSLNTNNLQGLSTGLSINDVPSAFENFYNSNGNSVPLKDSSIVNAPENHNFTGWLIQDASWWFNNGYPRPVYNYGTFIGTENGQRGWYSRSDGNYTTLLLQEGDTFKANHDGNKFNHTYIAYPYYDNVIIYDANGGKGSVPENQNFTGVESAALADGSGLTSQKGGKFVGWKIVETTAENQSSAWWKGPWLSTSNTWFDRAANPTTGVQILRAGQTFNGTDSYNKTYHAYAVYEDTINESYFTLVYQKTICDGRDHVSLFPYCDKGRHDTATTEITGEMPSRIILPSDGTTYLDENQFKWYGHTFAGWRLHYVSSDKSTNVFSGRVNGNLNWYPWSNKITVKWYNPGDGFLQKWNNGIVYAEASWVENPKFTVSYDKNSTTAKGSMPDEQHYCYEPFNLTKNKFTDEHKQFLNWTASTVINNQTYWYGYSESDLTQQIRHLLSIPVNK